MADKQLRTLTVRIPGEKEREAIRYVMRESGCGRAAQAMLFACTAYQIANERDKSMIERIQQQSKEQNRKQQRVINSLMAENERLRKALKVMQDGLAALNSTMQDLQKPLAEGQEKVDGPNGKAASVKASIPPGQGSE